MRRSSILPAFGFRFSSLARPGQACTQPNPPSSRPFNRAGADSEQRRDLSRPGRGAEPRSHVILRLASGAQRRFEWRDEAGQWTELGGF